MFEKTFRLGMQHGARILFILAITFFVINIVNALRSLMPMSYPSDFRQEILTNVLPFLFSGLMPAGYMLVGALLVDRADKIIEHLCAAPQST